jgi:glycosyltransferase involved in cell wall biosynthesis
VSCAGNGRGADGGSLRGDDRLVQRIQRILYCTDSLMAGGTEQQLVELVTRLDRTRFEPTVLCLYGESAGRSLHFLPHLRESGIPVIVLDLERDFGGKLRGMVEICRCVRRVKPDIVQMVNYHSNLLVRLVRFFLPFSIQLIGCVYVEYTAKQLLYERLSAWLCHAVVCNSFPIERQLRVAGVQRPVDVILNGIDIERFAGASDPSLRERVSPDARRVLLFLGRISHQKSPHLLAEAMTILKAETTLPPDVAVWIVGEIDDIEEQRLLNDAIDEHGLGKYFVQLPATAAPEGLYAAADVLVLPSRREGLANVILEAMASGHPVIVSEAANTVGLVRHGINGWVFPLGDAGRLADLLRVVLVLTDEALIAMRAACQETVAPFGVEKMVHRYEVLYERLSARS